LEPISSLPACATEPIWAQFETTNAAVYLTYTRRATAMKCAQIGPSLRVGVKATRTSKLRLGACFDTRQEMCHYSIVLMPTRARGMMR